MVAGEDVPGVAAEDGMSVDVLIDGLPLGIVNAEGAENVSKEKKKLKKRKRPGDAGRDVKLGVRVLRAVEVVADREREGRLPLDRATGNGVREVCP